MKLVKMQFAWDIRLHKALQESTSHEFNVEKNLKDV